MRRKTRSAEEQYQRYKQNKERKESQDKSSNQENSHSKEALLKKLAEERQKRLTQIKAKEQNRAERAENEELEEAKEEQSELDEDENQENSEQGVSKQQLTPEEIEKLKQKAIDDKNKKSSRDILKEKIADLEKQISKTKYNKKTQHAIGLMKGQVAALKQKLSEGKGKGGASDHGYNVKKSGDGTVVLLGFPSAGKSTLLNKITGAESETGAYAFTTLTCIPGMLDYKHAKIQILDVPGIVEGAAAGTGRGKEVLQVIRTADLILILVDATNPAHYDAILKEVYEAHVRINQEKPDVKIKKTSKNGIRIGRTVETPELDDETAESILKQFRIINAEVLIRSPITADQFIDIIEGNKAYLPAIKVVSKKDLIDSKAREKIQEKVDPKIFISAVKDEGIEELKEIIFDALGFIRIYLKEINKKADMKEPMIMRRGATLRDLCQKLHKDFVDKFQFAKIWGPSAKFDEQKLMKLDHEIKDGDVIEVHLK